jgi:cellulose 1,4-beta-cellobiosidase
MSLTLAALSLASVALAQKAGTLETESHLPITWQTCTTSGCTNVDAEIVIDANWRWTHGELKRDGMEPGKKKGGKEFSG